MSSLCPTRTRYDPKPTQTIQSDFSVWVSSVSSCIESVSSFVTGTEFGRIRQDLARSVEIRPRFRQITVRSRQISKDLNPISTRSHQIWSRMLNISPKMLKLRFGSSFSSFEIETRQPTRSGWVREIRTRIWSPKSSDRVAAVQTRVGWPSWVSSRAEWTPLFISK